MRWTENNDSGISLYPGVILRARLLKVGHGWFGEICLQEKLQKDEIIIWTSKDSYSDPRAAKSWCNKALSLLSERITEWKEEK